MGKLADDLPDVDWASRERERAEAYAQELRDREEQIARRLRALEAVEKARGMSADYNPTGFPAPVRAAYLLALETHGTQHLAAQGVGVSRASVQVYGGRVHEFVAAEREAIAVYRDTLAAELNRRARDGVVQLRFNRNGEPIGEAVSYSDGLLSKALDRADRIIGDLPDSSAGGLPLDGNLVSRLSAEGRAALRIVLSELAGLVPTAEDAQHEGIPAAIDV